VETLQGHPAEVSRLALSNNGRWLAAGSAGGSVALWDLQSRTIATQWFLPNASYPALAFTKDDRRLLAGDKKGDIHIWDVPSGMELFRLSAPDEEQGDYNRDVTSLIIDPIRGEPVTSHLDRSIRIWRRGPHALTTGQSLPDVYDVVDPRINFELKSPSE
jgi:WD40 repeat protein